MILKPKKFLLLHLYILMYIIETNDMCNSQVCPYGPLDPAWNELSSTPGRNRGEGFYFTLKWVLPVTSIHPYILHIQAASERRRGGLNACKHGKKRQDAEGKIKLPKEDGKEPKGRSEGVDRHDSA